MSTAASPGQFPCLFRSFIEELLILEGTLEAGRRPADCWDFWDRSTRALSASSRMGTQRTLRSTSW